MTSISPVSKNAKPFAERDGTKLALAANGFAFFETGEMEVTFGRK